MFRARPLFAAACLVAGCVVPPAPTRSESPPPTPPAEVHRPDVAEVRGWLGSFGVELDRASIPIETVPEAEAQRRLGARARRLTSDERIEQLRAASWLILGDSGLDVPLESIRRAFTQRSLHETLAYYDGSGIVVIGKQQTWDTPWGALLAHELVHAYQDQLLGGELFARFGALNTIDAGTAFKLCVEGHATFVSTAAVFDAQGVPPAQLPPSVFEATSAHVLAPGASGYDKGAIAMLSVYEWKGLAGIDALLLDPPPSSEQVLHPAKLGLDQPTPIDPPRLGSTTPRWVGTLGELTMYNLLVAKLRDSHRVRLATTGWDGDAIAWFDLDTGPTLVWRTVWDRPKDVEQFADLLENHEGLPDGAYLAADGRVLDIVVVAPPAGSEDARAIAERLPPIAVGPSDGAASTVRSESDDLAALDDSVRLVDGFAEFRDSGVRIPIPVGWQLSHVSGVPTLRAPLQDGFVDNIIVEVTPNLLGAELDTLETEILRQLELEANAEVLGHDRRVIAGRDAWVVDVHRQKTPSSPDVRQVQAVFVTSTHIVALVATASTARWTRRAGTFASVLAGIEPAQPVSNE